MTAEQARTFAQRWIQAWNKHDLEAVLADYAEDVVLISPVVTQLDNPSGTIQGKAALRAYYKKGLERFPHLNFQLIETMWGQSTVIVYYVNHKATRSCDFFEFDAGGKIVRNLVHYTG
jgi:hypothetical protein